MYFFMTALLSYFLLLLFQRKDAKKLSKTLKIYFNVLSVSYSAKNRAGVKPYGLQPESLQLTLSLTAMRVRLVKITGRRKSPRRATTLAVFKGAAARALAGGFLGAHRLENR